MIISLSAGLSGMGQESHGLLRVTPNGHYLQYEDGAAFFWLGDTGWELFHRLTLDEIVLYLDNRKSKGFNVIQAVIIAELDGIHKGNRYGEVPLMHANPDEPNEKYFSLVDTVVALAEKRGIIMALLPAWGDKVTLKYGGTGPVIFDTESGYRYGRFLGNRYKRFNNIVWILGGDRPPQDDQDDWKPVYRNIARGIKEGSGRNYLMSFHPGGYVWESSVYLHQESWLSFNMIQSGHAERDQPVWKGIMRDWNLQPVKPVIDAEPCYEEHPVNPWNNNWKESNGFFDDYEVRKQVYRSVFAGGFGVTYGNHSIWQFYQPGEEKVSLVRRYWQDALNSPGSYEMGYLRKLIESRPFLNRIPDTAIIEKGRGIKSDYVTAFRDSLGRYMMVYLPEGKRVTLNTSFIKSKEIRAYWFEPKSGKIKSNSLLKNRKRIEFIPPSLGAGNDWVLILDNADEDFNTFK